MGFAIILFGEDGEWEWKMVYTPELFPDVRLAEEVDCGDCPLEDESHPFVFIGNIEP